MAEPAFKPGMAVKVRDLTARGHVRTPAYVRGRHGWIERLQGRFPDPERRAYGADGLPPVPLYLVRFRQSDLWPGYSGADSLILDVFEHWLEPAE
jgi:nitrile hydratase subunit beta